MFFFNLTLFHGYQLHERFDVSSLVDAYDSLEHKNLKSSMAGLLCFPLFIFFTYSPFLSSLLLFCCFSMFLFYFLYLIFCSRFCSTSHIFSFSLISFLNFPFFLLSSFFSFFTFCFHFLLSVSVLNSFCFVFISHILF